MSRVTVNSRQLQVKLGKSGPCDSKQKAEKIHSFATEKRAM
jgi:hypothetical protein